MGSPNPGYWGKLTVIIGRDITGAAFPLLGDSCTLGRERGDINFPDDGYVSDEDASKIDYKEMLADMQKETREENAQRKEAGYETVDLIGWAVPPRYDAASKKLYWARELAFQGNDGHTLNYDIRVLGRHGYLSLNAIAGMDELPPGVTRKRLQLLKRAAPSISRVALLSTTPGRGGHETQLADAEGAARDLGFSVKVYRASTLGEMTAALDAIGRLHQRALAAPAGAA